MRLTCALCHESHRWQLKNLWRHRGIMKEPRSLIPPALQQSGAQIHDPVKEFLEKPVVDYPDAPIIESGFNATVDKTQMPDYHEEPLLTFGPNTKLLQALKQAQVLTKTLVASAENLPQASMAGKGKITVPKQDELMQRFIMQANVWDPTKEKLPKRFNPALPGWHFKSEKGIPERKIVHIMLRNLLRISEMASVYHPSLYQDRKLANEAYVSAYFSMQGTPIQIFGEHEYLVTSKTPLSPFADEDAVDETVVTSLPDIFPLHPTIDLEARNHYTMDNITTWASGFSHPHPHTLYISHYLRGAGKNRHAKALMYMFAHCLAHAKQTYGWDTKALPQPISMQCVVTDKATFDLYAFQLNTLDFSSADGIKNQLWMDTGNALYRKILPKRAMLRNTKYEDYDADVLEKLLAMYATGWDEGQADHVNQEGGKQRLQG